MNSTSKLTRQRSKQEALFLVDSCVAKKRDPASFTEEERARHARHEAERQARKSEATK